MKKVRKSNFVAQKRVVVRCSPKDLVKVATRKIAGKRKGFQVKHEVGSVGFARTENCLVVENGLQTWVYRCSPPIYPQLPTETTKTEITLTLV